MNIKLEKTPPSSSFTLAGIINAGACGSYIDSQGCIYIFDGMTYNRDSVKSAYMIQIIDGEVKHDFVDNDDDTIVTAYHQPITLTFNAL